MNIKKRPPLYIVFFILSFFILTLFVNCKSTAASAEEYFLIGMAYFDLGKFEEAEKWLNRARQADRTMTASTYNLGRLAFERRQYDDAVKHFERILRRDPENILALQAAAYTRIMLEDFERADSHYSKLLTLVPESADNGYNHALVLFAMKRFTAAEDVLKKFPIALQENKDVMLLYARTQAAMNKIEAIERFSVFLNLHSDLKARYEYAQVLEQHEFYARALEEYRKTLSDLPETSADPKRNEVRFAIARVLLIADSASAEGVTELQGAVTDGFNNIAAVEGLAARASQSNRDAIRNILNAMRSEANP